MIENLFNLDALIEALVIFRKYVNPNFPTMCEHGTLYIQGPNPEKVSKDDYDRLIALGFIYDSNLETWQSFRFGSA